MPGARRRGRPRTAWIDIINTWTGLHVEESIRMTEGRDKWRKYVHGMDSRGLRVKGFCYPTRPIQKSLLPDPICTRRCNFYSAPQCSHCKLALQALYKLRQFRLSVRHTPVLCENDGT